MPLLTGGGMDFEARTTEPSTLIRLPGALVRAQFAKPAGLAFLASSAWSRQHARDRPDHRPRRPTAGRSPNSCTATCCWSDPTDSVRDVVVADDRAPRVLRADPAAATADSASSPIATCGPGWWRPDCPSTCPIAEVMSAPARTRHRRSDRGHRADGDAGMRAAAHAGADAARRGRRRARRRRPAGRVGAAELHAASFHRAGRRRGRSCRRSGQRVTGIAVDLFRNGTKATATSAILSVVIDSLVRRALELVLAQTGSTQISQGSRG